MSETEEDFIRQKYFRMSNREIARQLNTTVGRVQEKIKKLGLRGKPNPKRPKGRGRKRQVSEAAPVQETGNFIVIGPEDSAGRIPVYVGGETMVYTTAEKLTKTVEKWKNKTTERTKFYEL